MISRRPSTRKRFPDVLELVPRTVVKLHSLWLSRTYPFASIGRNVSIHWTCRLHRSVAPAIRLGNFVVLHKDTWLGVTAAPAGDKPTVIIDDDVSVGARCQISAKNLIHVERDTILSASVLLMDHSHAYEDTEKPISKQGTTPGGTIRIGKGCWIGQGAAIVCTRGELVLGPNCVVGANSVVLRSAPAYSVLCGNPARVVKQFDPVSQTWHRESEQAAAVGCERQFR